jgi:hypothetical protein
MNYYEVYNINGINVSGTDEGTLFNMIDVFNMLEVKPITRIRWREEVLFRTTDMIHAIKTNNAYEPYINNEQLNILIKIAQREKGESIALLIIQDLAYSMK